MMGKRNLFNGFGYAGQHGQAGKLIETIWENQQQIITDIDGLLEDVPTIAEDVNEIAANKVTLVDENSTDAQYPSARCVYNILGDIEALLANI